MKFSKYTKQPLAVMIGLTGGKQGAAVLFFDLFWFYSRSTEVVNGRPVLALTDNQLSERTGLTIPQVRRAKRFLKKNGYVKTEVRKNAKYHGGNTVTHFLIPPEVLSLVKSLVEGTAQMRQFGNEQNCIGSVIQGCTVPLYIEKEKKIEELEIPPQELAQLSSKDYELAQLKKLKELFE